MLVVVFIIGILVSTLIPRLVNAQERTKDVIIKKDLKDLQLALETYYADGGTFVLSGAGFQGKWYWRLSQKNGTYPVSIMTRLNELWYLKTPIIPEWKKIPIRDDLGIICFKSAMQIYNIIFMRPSMFPILMILQKQNFDVSDLLSQIADI